MTARSYSETTLKQMNNDSGIVNIINITERINAIVSMVVEMPLSAEIENKT